MLSRRLKRHYVLALRVATPRLEMLAWWEAKEKLRSIGHGMDDPDFVHAMFQISRWSARWFEARREAAECAQRDSCS